MKMFVRLSMLGLVASALAGCGAGASEDSSMDTDMAAQEGVSQVQDALGSCYGDSCTGTDPGATGCESDARTVASSNITNGSSVIGTIAIRYSPSCNAAWARTSTNFGAYFLRAEITRNSPYATAQAASPTATTAQRSPMVGVHSGSSFTAWGRIGPQYNYYPYTGNVTASF